MRHVELQLTWSAMLLQVDPVLAAGYLRSLDIASMVSISLRNSL